MKRRRAPRRVDLTSADLNDIDWAIIRRALEDRVRFGHATGNDAVAFAAQRTLQKVQRR